MKISFTIGDTGVHLGYLLLYILLGLAVKLIIIRTTGVASLLLDIPISVACYLFLDWCGRAPFFLKG